MSLTAILVAAVAAAVAWCIASWFRRSPAPAPPPPLRPTPSEGLAATAAATTAAADPEAQAAAAAASPATAAVVVLADDLRAQADIVAGMIGASKPQEPPK